MRHDLCVRIGGFGLYKGEDLMAEVGNVVKYHNLKPQYVKVLWDLLVEDDEIAQAYHHFSKVVGRKLSNIGNQWVDLAEKGED